MNHELTHMVYSFRSALWLCVVMLTTTQSEKVIYLCSWNRACSLIILTAVLVIESPSYGFQSSDYTMQKFSYCISCLPASYSCYPLHSIRAGNLNRSEPRSMASWFCPVMWPLLECWRCFTGPFGVLDLLLLTEVYTCGSDTCEIWSCVFCLRKWYEPLILVEYLSSEDMCCKVWNRAI